MDYDWLIILICVLTGLMECNFENGLCKWSQVTNDTSDQFDWTRINGTTPSSGTGPSQSATGPTGKSLV